MGGDDSQKLLALERNVLLSGAQTSGSIYEINNVAETAVEISRRHSWPTWPWPQLPPAWVIFGKHTRVSSGARRSAGALTSESCTVCTGACNASAETSPAHQVGL